MQVQWALLRMPSFRRLFGCPACSMAMRFNCLALSQVVDTAKTAQLAKPYEKCYYLALEDPRRRILSLAETIDWTKLPTRHFQAGSWPVSHIDLLVSAL